MSLLLQRGKARDLKAMVTEELEAGTPPQDILNNSLIVGMGIVGEKFKNNEVFVPEVLITARAMNMALEVLRPALAQQGVEPVGTAVICTVKGDMHDIGKNLVKMMIEGTGIRVIDLGTDCDKDKVVEAVKEYNADIVCLHGRRRAGDAGLRRFDRRGHLHPGRGLRRPARKGAV